MSKKDKKARRKHRQDKAKGARRKALPNFELVVTGRPSRLHLDGSSFVLERTMTPLSAEHRKEFAVGKTLILPDTEGGSTLSWRTDREVVQLTPRWRHYPEPQDAVDWFRDIRVSTELAKSEVRSLTYQGVTRIDGEWVIYCCAYGDGLWIEWAVPEDEKDAFVASTDGDDIPFPATGSGRELRALVDEAQLFAQLKDPLSGTSPGVSS